MTPNKLSLSIIIPVWNEEKTIEKVLNQIINLDFNDYLVELIIVESNSTDKTKNIIKDVLANSTIPGNLRTTIIFQDKPNGKGHAVRAGLKIVTYEIVAIIDADDEYEINDLFKLLSPIIECKADFVLGSRIKNDYSIRDFHGQKHVSIAFNLAQFIFTKLFNLFYLNRLKDPFTMWKVFRIESISQINFVSNRFDFDWEIVSKVLRKGIIPVEIDIEYTSRGFRQGKKVKIFKDGLLALRALVRFRFGKL